MGVSHARSTFTATDRWSRVTETTTKSLRRPSTRSLPCFEAVRHRHARCHPPSRRGKGERQSRTGPVFELQRSRFARPLPEFSRYQRTVIRLASPILAFDRTDRVGKKHSRQTGGRALLSFYRTNDGALRTREEMWEYPSILLIAQSVSRSVDEHESRTTGVQPSWWVCCRRRKSQILSPPKSFVV